MLCNSYCITFGRNMSEATPQNQRNLTHTSMYTHVCYVCVRTERDKNRTVCTALSSPSKIHICWGSEQKAALGRTHSVVAVCLWLCWVFVAAFPSCGEQGLLSLLWAGFSLQFLLLQSTGSRGTGFSSWGSQTSQLCLTGSRAQAQ